MFFFIPVRYVKEDILNIKKIAILQECNSLCNFINKTIKRKEIIIGLSIPTKKTETWIRVEDYMNKYAISKGVKVKIKNADFDGAKQASQVDDLISQGIDILILAPVDSVGAADIVEKVHEAGIKVIAYDRIIKYSDLDLLVTFDNLRNKYIL